MQGVNDPSFKRLLETVHLRVARLKLTQRLVLAVESAKKLVADQPERNLGQELHQNPISHPVILELGKILEVLKVIKSSICSCDPLYQKVLDFEVIMNQLECSYDSELSQSSFLDSRMNPIMKKDGVRFSETLMEPKGRVTKVDLRVYDAEQVQKMVGEVRLLINRAIKESKDGCLSVMLMRVLESKVLMFVFDQQLDLVIRSILGKGKSKKKKSTLIGTLNKKQNEIQKIQRRIDRMTKNLDSLLTSLISVNECQKLISDIQCFVSLYCDMLGGLSLNDPSIQESDSKLMSCRYWTLVDVNTFACHVCLFISLEVSILLDPMGMILETS